METVLIVGATGNTGTQIAKRLKEHDSFKPLAMVRKTEQQKAFEDIGIDTRLADLEEDLTTVVAGVDRVIFAAGAGGGASKEKTTIIDQESAKRLIDVAKMGNIKKFVMLSSIHADDPESNEDLKHYLMAKKNADEHLKKSGLKFTIVRPGSLNNNAGTGKIELKSKFEKHGEISREDVAKTLVAVLSDQVADQATFEIIEGHTNIAEALGKV